MRVIERQIVQDEDGKIRVQCGDDVIIVTPMAKAEPKPKPEPEPKPWPGRRTGELPGPLLEMLPPSTSWLRHCQPYKVKSLADLDAMRSTTVDSFVVRCVVVEISSSLARTEESKRDLVEEARRILGDRNQVTLLFLDEGQA